MSLLNAPASSHKQDVGSGVRALVLAPTRELAHQIHNECLKLAQGRKWRIVLFSKATASTLADKAVRDQIGAGSAATDIVSYCDSRHCNQYAATTGGVYEGGNY